MKVVLLMMTFFVCAAVFSQKNLKGLSSETLDAAKNNVFSPKIFNGQISANPTVSNLGLNLTDQSINLQGIIYESDSGRFIASINVKGNNENTSLGLFGKGNLNAKIESDFNFTYNLPAKVRYTYNSNNEVDKNPSYNTIFRDTVNYSVNRQRFKSGTIGVTGAGAKYYLIDSSATFENMVNKRSFTGWQLYGQFNIIDFHNKKKLALIHSFRVSYGEVNNVSDLTEYSISNSTSFSSAANSRKFERKITGYFDEYFVQHQGILSYEFNFYDMDTTQIKVGLIGGFDFVYNSKQKNFMRYNAGLNFPVEFKKDDKATRRLYIGAILSSTDPYNWRQKDDFALKNTFSASLRLVSPIKINFKD